LDQIPQKDEEENLDPLTLENETLSVLAELNESAVEALD
jgi:hypothetical protein